MNEVRQLIEALKNLLTWWVTVAPWEQAIRVRLGKHVRLLAPGVHLRIPLADRVYRQSVRRRIAPLPAQTLTTRDGKALTVAVVVGYKIVDLLRLYDTLHHAEGTINGLVAGEVGRFVLETNSGECRPADLSTRVSERLSLEKYGIGEVSVTPMTFAFVRTFRFITGDGNAWSYGDPLETSRELQQESGPR